MPVNVSIFSINNSPGHTCLAMENLLHVSGFYASRNTTYRPRIELWSPVSLLNRIFPVARLWKREARRVSKQNHPDPSSLLNAEMPRPYDVLFANICYTYASDIPSR